MGMFWIRRGFEKAMDNLSGDTITNKVIGNFNFNGFEAANDAFFYEVTVLPLAA